MLGSLTLVSPKQIIKFLKKLFWIDVSCMVLSSEIYPLSLFGSCYQYTLEFIFVWLQTFREIIIMRIWLLRCTKINEFCWWISLCLCKEPRLFDKNTLLGHTRHLVIWIAHNPLSGVTLSRDSEFILFVDEFSLAFSPLLVQQEYAQDAQHLWA